MRNFLLAAVLLGCGAPSSRTVTIEGAIEAVRDEVGRHHQAASAALLVDGAAREARTHEYLLSGRTQVVRREVEGRCCCDSAGHDRMIGAMDALDAQALVHLRALESAGDLDGIRAECDGYRDRAMAQIDLADQTAGQMRCGMMGER